MMDEIMKPHKQYIVKKGHVYFKTVLRKWVMQGESDKVKSIIKGVNQADLTDSTGSNFLHVSSKYKNVKMMTILIQLGYNVDAKNRAGETPLVLCLLAKNFDGIVLLLEANADISVTNPEGCSILKMYFSLDFTDARATKFLVQKTRDNCANDKDAVEKLLEAGCRLAHIILCRDPEFTKIYLDHPGPTRPLDGIAERIAMANNDTENLKVLFFYGDLDDCVHRRNVLLFDYLCSRGHFKLTLQTLKLCMELYNDWKILNETTAEFVANLGETENANTLRVVLETGINEYLKNDFGCDLLVHAYGNPNAKVREWIKTQNVDIHSTSINRQTIMHLAAKNCVFKNLKDLLILGINPNITDDTGKTPIFYIFHNEHERHIDVDESEKCVELLLKHGCNIQVCDNFGKTFIEYVSDAKNYSSIFKMILKHLAVLKVQGVPTKIQIENYLRRFSLIDLYNKYCCQLEQMKVYTVCEKVPLFTILTSNTELVCHQVRLLNKKSFEKLLSDFKSYKYDWYYVFMLKERINEAMDINELRKKAMFHIGNNIPVLKSYYYILRKIVCFLSYEYLQTYKYLGLNCWKKNRELSDDDSIKRNLSCAFCRNHCKGLK